MPKQLPRIGLFISELNRRRVFRAAVWYAAVGWAIIEVTSTIFPIFNFPDWTTTATVVAVLAGAPVAMLLAWAFDFTPQGVQRTEARPAPARPVSAKSVAVLPFENLSDEPGSEYFSDGITEDVIAAVARLRDLKVISRTSVMHYKKTRPGVPQIAAELGVAHVLEGSVRRAGQRVRIVAQLVDARTDRHLWAETYDREIEDIFAIQSEVAQRIAGSLNAELTQTDRSHLQRGPTAQIDAYEAYLQARHLWSHRTEASIRRAIEQLERALDIDGDFALAWAALAECQVTLGLYAAAPPVVVMPQAREAAARALELDASLAEALTPLAAVAAYYDWDWDGADAHFRKAIAANPHYPTAHHWHANVLAARGRFDEARAALERARDLDPLSAVVLANFGIIAYLERDYRRAIQLLRTVVARQPGFVLSQLFLGLALEADGSDRKAIDVLKKAVDLSDRSVETRAALIYTLGRHGQLEDAQRLLQTLASQTFVSPTQLAYGYIGVGDYHAAVARLEEAVDQRATDVVWLAVRPAFDPLRGDQRFAALVERLGLAGTAAAVRP